MCGCLSHTPKLGPGLQPRHVPWLGIEPATLWFAGWHAIHWATPARAFSPLFWYYSVALVQQVSSLIFKIEIYFMYHKINLFKLELSVWRVSFEYLLPLFLIVEKFPFHEISIFNHFYGYNSVGIRIFTIIRNYRHDPFPELFHHLKQKFCTQQTILFITSPLRS